MADLDLLLAQRLEFGDGDALSKVLDSIGSVGRLLQALRRSLRRKLEGETHFPFPTPHSREA